MVELFSPNPKPRIIVMSLEVVSYASISYQRKPRVPTPPNANPQKIRCCRIMVMNNFLSKFDKVLFIEKVGIGGGTLRFLNPTYRHEKNTVTFFLLEAAWVPKGPGRFALHLTKRSKNGQSPINTSTSYMQRPGNWSNNELAKQTN